MNKRLRHWFLMAIAAIVFGCASVDFDYPKTASAALHDTEDTYFGQRVSDMVAANPGKAGFFPLPDGIDALAARLLLATKAERSIDAQYYLIKNDITGNAFIGSLLQAADRGVRVRLLLDDISTSGYDAGMAGLDSHANFEIRIFNPFARRSARFMDGLTSFSRVNRRMHNKSFTVDNQVTIIGGRNIADEYFGAREDAKFGDLDVLGVGPLVNDVSNMFDRYWSHERTVPIAAFANMPDDPTAELHHLRAKIEQSSERIETSKYASAVRIQALEYLGADTSAIIWAHYSLVVDSPDKAFKSKAKSATSITTPLRDSLLSAKTEVIVVSPYFVPSKAIIKTISGMQRAGVDVTVITNSLAANNQLSVHSGYAPSRKPLLKSGVKLFEVRADADVPGSEIVASSNAKATLHTKTFIVDRRELFIGSFNFDPRSSNINTEMGVIIRSPKLAAHYTRLIRESLAEQTYEVILGEKGNLRWRGLENGEEVIFDREPQTTRWQRFAAGFMKFLPIRGQL